MVGLVTANQFSLVPEISRLGTGFAQGQQIGQQFRQGQRATTAEDQRQSELRRATINDIAINVRNLPLEQRAGAIEQAGDRFRSANIDINAFPLNDLSDVAIDQVIAATGGAAKIGELTSEQKTFSGLTEGLPEDKVRLAKDIALGLKSRKQGGAARVFDIGGVPHIFDPDTKTMVPAKVGGTEVTAKTVGATKAEITQQVDTAKKKATRIATLKEGKRGRQASIDKAQTFLDAFNEGAESGATRKGLSFIPGAFTDQAEFDEKFNAFAEVAARQQLKASGETRPTDADVEGMKRAMFGVGRSEAVNMALLEEFINEQQNLDAELSELEPSKLGSISNEDLLLMLEEARKNP